MDTTNETNGNDKKDEKYEELNRTLNHIICENLKALLKARDISQKKFCQELAKKKTSITRSYLSRLLKNPFPTNISAVFLLSCCDFFGVSLQNLASPDFNANEYTFNDTPEHHDYLDIAALMKETQKLHKESQTSILSKPEIKTHTNFLLPFNNSNLITDPDHTLFSGYIQDYYCYYYPTHSSENRNSENILKGILRLEKDNNYCKATLKINTNTVDDNGNTNYKKYIGYAAISPTVNSLNCIMYSDSLCEFCFLMFRYFKLNFGKQDCRIAEVLSSSSADESRRPTVLRMLLSKEEITDVDLKIISPSFLLNYSTIAINEESLDKVAKLSEDYNKIINELVNSTQSQPIYFCKEDSIFTIAQHYLEKKEDILEFLMQLRSLSYSYRYNKVSGKADEAVRKILLSKGYYKKNSAPKKDYPVES